MVVVFVFGDAVVAAAMDVAAVIVDASIFPAYSCPTPFAVVLLTHNISNQIQA